MQVSSFMSSSLESMQDMLGPTAAYAATYVRPFFGACAAAMIAVLAAQAANSPQGGEAFGKLLYRLFLVGMIFAFTLNPDTYQGEIAQVAWNLPREWMSVLARRAGTSDPALVIDNTISTTLRTAGAYSAIGAQRGVWSGFWWQVSAFMVYGFGGLVSFGTASILLAGYAVLSLSIAVGPVFGSMLAFQMTRGMGIAWTGTLIAPGIAVSMAVAMTLIMFGYWDQEIVAAAQNADRGLAGALETGGAGLMCIGAIGAVTTLGYTLGRGVQPALSGFMANMQRSAMSLAGSAGGMASLARPRNAMHVVARMGHDARIVRAPVQAVKAAWRGRP